MQGDEDGEEGAQGEESSPEALNAAQQRPKENLFDGDQAEEDKQQFLDNLDEDVMFE